MTETTFTIFDADPTHSGDVAWPHMTQVPGDASDAERAIHDAGVDAWYLVWDEAGTVLTKGRVDARASVPTEWGIVHIHPRRGAFITLDEETSESVGYHQEEGVDSPAYADERRRMYRELQEIADVRRCAIDVNATTEDGYDWLAEQILPEAEPLEDEDE